MYPIAPGGAKLLLISPPDHEHREWRGTQPLGIAYLAGYLRQHGARADLLDGNWGDHPLPLDEIVAYALAGEYETVGISLLTATIPTARALSQRLKAQRPRLQIIWGGYHPTFAPYESLNDFPEIDIVVRGEGEATLLELLQAQQSGRPLAEVAGLGYREGKRIKLTPARPLLQNLDEIPFPARDLLPPVSSYPGFMDTVDQKPRIKASLISSRGCPFHCHFCSIITFYAASPGKSWRGRSVANVVDEMEQLARQGGVSHFEFQDDNFFVQPKRALEIAEALRARGVDFTFAFLTRADQIVKGEKYFPAFRQAGLRYVGAGLESGSQGSLDRLNKETTVEENSAPWASCGAMTWPPRWISSCSSQIPPSRTWNRIWTSSRVMACLAISRRSFCQRWPCFQARARVRRQRLPASHLAACMNRCPIIFKTRTPPRSRCCWIRPWRSLVRPGMSWSLTCRMN
ncbi:MAG: cobalamin-dependent protein [Anaerolineae bacterium]|nr:cobalamin-dependent protein [Anaerolineae bacterium]